MTAPTNNTYFCKINGILTTVPYNISRNPRANRVGFERFDFITSPIRTKIWSFLKITDFNSLYRSCREMRHVLDGEDLELLAKKYLNLFETPDHPSLLEIKEALYRANKINILYIERYTLQNTCLGKVSMVHIHNKMNTHFSMDNNIKVICQANNIDLNNRLLKQRFVAYLNPQLKKLMTDTANGNTQPNPYSRFGNPDNNDYSLSIKFGNLTFDFCSLIQDNDLFKEFESSNFDLEKLLKTFHMITSGEDTDSLLNVKQLFTLYAIKSVFNDRFEVIRQFQYTSTQIVNIRNKIEFINEFIPSSDEKTKLERLGEFDHSLRAKLIDGSPNLVKYQKVGLIDFESIRNQPNPSTLNILAYQISNSNRLFQWLINEPTEVKNQFKDHINLYNCLVQNIKFFTPILNDPNFSFSKFFTLSRDNRELFINNSKLINRLCTKNLITLQESFNNLKIFEKLLSNIVDFDSLCMHWSLKGINIYSLDSDLLNYMLTNASELRECKWGKTGFKEFCSSFPVIPPKCPRPPKKPKKTEHAADFEITTSTTTTNTNSNAPLLYPGIPFQLGNMIFQPWHLNYYPQSIGLLNQYALPLNQNIVLNENNPAVIEDIQENADGSLNNQINKEAIDFDEDLSLEVNEEDTEEIFPNISPEDPEELNDDIPVQGSRSLKRRPHVEDLNPKPSKLKDLDNSDSEEEEEPKIKDLPWEN